MKITLLKSSKFWRMDGTIGRGEYFCIGVALFLIKFCLDRLIALFAFGSAWEVSNYFFPALPGSSARLLRLYLTMLAVSLPFVWIGVVLSVRRLRSAGLARGWVALFFVPIANLFLFAVLSIAPERFANPPKIVEIVMSDEGVHWRSAIIAMVIVGAAALGGTLLSTALLASYGLGLFIAMPFCLGMVSVFIYGFRRPRSLGQSMFVCFCSIMVAGASLLFFAFEGLICLIMAAPLAIALAMLGGLVAHTILSTTRWRREADKMLCAAFLLIPMAMTVEQSSDLEPPLLCVRTAVDVKAPPNVVWRHVINFSKLPPPHEWIFHAGVAYPTCAEIAGHGPGAVRKCQFSTGPFVEPIQVWDEPHLLKFSVLENPEPLQELSPYRNVHPPHLHGFLVSEEGQFLLTENPDGSTRLEGTTWYRHNMWPAGYWEIWSDHIIHKIHRRVLDHVKYLAEADKER